MTEISLTDPEMSDRGETILGAAVVGAAVAEAVVLHMDVFSGGSSDEGDFKSKRHAHIDAT